MTWINEWMKMFRGLCLGMEVFVAWLTDVCLIVPLKAKIPSAFSRTFHVSIGKKQYRFKDFHLSHSSIISVVPPFNTDERRNSIAERRNITDDLEMHLFLHGKRMS